MTSTGFRNSVSGHAGREKSVELQNGTPAMYLTLEDVVEARKAKDAASVA